MDTVKRWALATTFLCFAAPAFAADSTITGLPAGSALAGTEPLPMDQAGATKKTTAADINTYINGTANTWTARQTFNAGITLGGNISSTSWGLTGLKIIGGGSTLTDTSAAGTVATGATDVLGGNTIAASNARTFTDYYSTYIADPTAGTNVTFTNKWSLGLAGSLSVGSNIRANNAVALGSGPFNAGEFNAPTNGGLRFGSTIHGIFPNGVSELDFIVAATTTTWLSNTAPYNRFNASIGLTGGTSSADVILSRADTAKLQLGAADAAGSAIAISSVASNQLTLASSHGLSNGAAVIITGTAAPSGTTLNTLYYARSISAAVIELYDTYQNAITTSGTTGRVSVTTAGTSASVRLSTPFQTFQPQSFTGTDIPGQPFIIKGSRGTGTGAGGSIIFQVAPAGTTGTSQNALATALTINSTKDVTFAGNQIITSPAFVGTNGLVVTGLGAGAGIRIADGDLRIYTNVTASNWAFFNTSTRFAMGSDTFLAWCNTSFADPTASSADVRLYRDAANTLALRNGTGSNGPQLFRVYSTYTDNTTNAFGGIGAAVNLNGTAGDANTLYIGSQKTGAPTALTKLAIQVDGTTRLDYNASVSASWYTSRDVYASGFAFATNRSYITSPSDSVITVSNNAANDFNRLQLGGTTSSFPALKRSSAKIQVVDAAGNFTGTSGLVTQNLNFQGVTIANLPAAPAAGDVAYVTDGDASLAWGATAVNSGSGATKYLVWYNGTNWTVAGK